MDPGTGTAAGLSISSRSEPERAYVIAALSGELDIACAPALREQLLGLLRPAASRLVIDLSAVSYADASGLAVLVATGRRAGLLGGFLRLAAPAPRGSQGPAHHRPAPAARYLPHSPGRDHQPGAWPAPAIRQSRREHGHRRRQHGAHRTRARAKPGGPGTPPTPVSSARPSPPCSCTPTRGVTPTPAAGSLPPCSALARAYAGTSHAALTQAADSLLSVLTRQPLTHSPAVAATASRLRRLLDADRRPALT